METQTAFITLVKETCIVCGIVFGIEADYRKSLLKSHNSFKCPNGHSQYFSSKTEVEKLKIELQRERSRADQVEADLREKDLTLRSTKGHLTRIKNRIVKGVCPCCNRTFNNLHRHMKTKHPKYIK